MDHPLPRHKGVYILPNLITTASLFAGFYSIILSGSSQYEAAAIAIIFSAFMDGLDGKIARLTNTASEFGVQYDSLADLVAFGVAPAYLIYHHSLASYERLGIAVSFLFAVCAALRLARFNVAAPSAGKKFFVGMPSPTAGGAIATLILFIPYFPQFIMRGFSGLALVYTALIAILMVTRIRYASFKEFGYFKARPFRTMVGVILLFALLISNPRFFLFLFLITYISSGLIYTFIYLPRMARAANRTTTPPSV